MKALGYIARVFELSLTEIGKSLEVTPQTVNEWVKSNKSIPKKRLNELSEIFNLPPGYFNKLESELNEVERLEIEIALLQSKNEFIFPEGAKYPFYTKSDEINKLRNKLEEKKLFLRMEKLFEGGTRLEDEDYNWKAVRNFQLFSKMVEFLENEISINSNMIEQLSVMLLGPKQVELFKMAEEVGKAVREDRKL
jgi:transcriptional regulator with XRE-family HTH domain